MAKPNSGNQNANPKAPLTPNDELRNFLLIQEFAQALVEVGEEVKKGAMVMPEMTIPALLATEPFRKANALRAARLSAAITSSDKAAKDAAEATKKPNDKDDKAAKPDVTDDNKPSLVSRFFSFLWKWTKRIVIAILVIVLLSWILGMVVNNGLKVGITTANTTVTPINVPNRDADVAAKDREIDRLNGQIRQLNEHNAADINSAARCQSELNGRVATLERNLNYYTSTGLGADLDRTKAQLAEARRNVESLRHDLDELQATRAREAKEHAEECNASERRIREEGTAAIASKDVVIGRLNWQLGNDQLLLETYRATANGQMAHLGERVDVDVVAFTRRDASFQLTLDGGQRTAEGVAIIQTVTGTNSGSFPRPTATFKTNAGLYTVGVSINGRSGETFRQFLGTAGEVVYMNLNGEATTDGKQVFRQYTFARATVLIWTGSCIAVRANPRSNDIPLPNGTVVELPDGTRVEVLNRQPVALASVNK